MRLWLSVIALLLACGPLMAQRHKIGEVNAGKPEGKLLQQIGQENDAGKKMVLMEQFLDQYPKHEAAGWVLEQYQPLCVKAKEIDKIIAAGEKLVALDADDTEAALQTLKAVETKKDAAVILKWSAITSAAARKMVAAPQPADAAAVQSWKDQVDYARQVDTYSEYALYRAGLENPDTKQKILLFETLEQRNPKSEYMGLSNLPLFLAYRQAGAADKSIALAERVLAADQSSEDMLLAVAGSYVETKREPQKVHAYAAKVAEILASKPKPAGVAEADWDKRRAAMTGLAHYLSGKLYYEESAFAPADRELRQALPLLSATPALGPEVLYLLGYANYKLDKAQDAANFYRECAALQGPYQALANKNLSGIRQQYKGIK